MPVIIKPEERDRWLNPDEHDPNKLTPLLAPYTSSELDAWEVSRAVNSPANNGPENIRPT